MVRDILTIATQTPGELSPLNGAKIIDYEFSSPRMGIPTLTATLMSYKCLDKLWTNREYVTLRGERYYLRDTPTSSKSNTDARYKHDLNFVSEREILNQVYFYDTVESYSFTYDRPCSNSTTFTFYGTIFELVDRINCALLYAGIGDSILKTKTALTTEDIPVGDGYCVMLDPDGDYDPNEVKEMSFTDQYIWSVLTTGYETYKVPFVFKGKACIFGAVDEVIDHTFQYGRKHELMSITKQNANAKLINRITFKGSSENIPYYYPNSSEYGHIDLVAGAGNVGIVLSDLTLENPRKLLAASREGSDIVYGSSNANIKPESVSSWRVEVGDDVVGGFERNKWYKFELTDEDYTDEDRPTTIPILVGFTFVTTDRGDVVIRELLGQTWLTNDSQPDNDRNMLTDGIEVVGLTNVASRKDYTDHVSTDSNFAMKDLPAGTYDLAVIINVNIVGRRDWRTFFWRISDVIFSGGESRKGWWVDNKFYPSIGNFGIVLREGATPVDGDKFHWTASGRMPFQTNLVPPKYRNTLGAERFYKALNAPYTESYASQHPDAYKDPDTNAPYVFANPFIEGNPDEYIFVDESIKPTIEGITNASGQLFGAIADIAYDSDDSDALKANVNQDDDANTENYAHSFFYIKLNIFNGPYGFDLFAHASQTDAMTLQMTSGKCAGCKFKIQAEELGADSAREFANPVQTTGPTGTIVDGTYTDKVKTGAAQEWQQNTQTNSIWICVQKDAETFGVIIPNVENNYKPAIGDKFNIINIDLPEAYILAAEKRGEEAMMRYMSDNNEERFDFEIDCSRIFFAQNPDILADLSESSKIRVAYDGETYELYVSNMAISCKAGEPLPNVKLTLAKDLTVGQSFAERVAARVASLIATPYNLGGALGTGNAALTDRRYLNKQKNDRTPYKLSSSTAFELGEFISGSSGGMFGVDKESGRTFLETDILRVRMKAVFERLEVVEANSVSGKTVITPGGGIEISFVEPRYEGNDLVSYRCYFKTEEDGKEGGCRFRVGDLIYCQDFKIENGVVTGDMSGVSGNHYYWRNLIAVSNENSYFDLSATDCDTLSDAPQAGDTVIQLGNRTDNTRQSAIIFSTVDASAPSVTLFHGINTYSLNQKEVVAYGVDKTKTPPEPFFNCYGRFYFGPRSKASYLQFEPSEGSLVFKGKLSVESSVGDQSLLDFIKENGGLNEDVENFVNQVIQGVQDQIDGVIETWFYNGVPTLSNYPAIEWDTDDLKIQHLGDLYYDNDTGTAYRFSQNAQGAYFWNVITDDAITKALSAAQKAQDTADGKRRVFTAQPTPPYDNGDLWVNATYPAGTTATTRDPSQNKYYLDILRCSTSKASGTTFSISDWVLASNYTDDTVAKQALSQIAGYEYIKNALLPENPTQIAGGLIMSTLISLGYTQDGERKNMAGLNGSWVDSLGGRTIAAWFGGPMIDRFDAQGNKITPIPANAATTLIRMDGSAYFAGGNVGFNSDGSGWLGNYDNGIRFDSVGGMTFGSGIKIALTSGDKGLKETLESIVNFMEGLGTAFIPEDSSGNKVAWNSTLLNRVRVTKGFYSDSFISAHGLNATGGSGGSGASTLAMLTDVSLSNPVSGQALVYNGSKWVNQTVAAQAGVTELGVSGNYLTWTKNSAVHNLTVPYATAAQSLAGNFIVSGGTEKPNAAIFGGGKLRLQMLSYANLGLPRSVSYWYDVLWLSAYAGGDEKASSALAFPKKNTSREIYLFSQDSDSEEWDSTPAKILTDANFDTTLGSAYVKKSGSTMTGLLDININGDSGVRFWVEGVFKGGVGYNGTYAYLYNQTYGYPLALYNDGKLKLGDYTIWHSGNDGEGSGLDADLLDGYHGSDYLRSFWTNNPGFDCATYAQGSFVTYTYNNNAPFGGPVAHFGAKSYGFYLGTTAGSGGSLYYRQHGSQADGGMGEWQRLARTTDNVASATKLANTRTIWGQNFNGEGNVNGRFTQDVAAANFTENAWFGSSNLGANQLCNIVFGKEKSRGNSGTFGHKHIADGSNQNMIVFGGYNFDNLLCIRYDGNVGIGTTSPAYKLDVAGNTRIGGKLIINGTNSDNDTRYITSDGASNIYFSVSGVISLVARNDCVRRGVSATSVSLGASDYPWNGVYAKADATTANNGTGFVIPSAGRISGNSIGHLGAYAIDSLYLRFGCGSDYSNMSNGLVLSSSGSTLSSMLTVSNKININSPAGTDGMIYCQLNGGTQIGFGVGTSTKRGIYDTSKGWLIYTDGTSTILPTLNVGIGTTSPAYKLDVNGTFRSTGTVTVPQIHVIGTASSSAYIKSDDAENIFFNVGGRTMMVWKNDENCIRPGYAYNGSFALGSPGVRWSNVYSVLGNFSGLLTASAGVKIGSATLTYDSATGMLKCDKGFYSEGAISAHGSSSGTSGGSGGNLSNFSFGKANSSDTYNTKLSITVGEITKSVTGVASTAEVAALQTLVNLYNTTYDGRFATSLSLSGSTLSLLKNNGGVLSSVTLPSASSGGSSTGAAGSLQYFTEQQFYESALGIGTLNSLVPTTLIGCIGTPAKPLRMLYTKEIMGLTDITAANYWPEVPGSSALGGTGDRFGVGYINDLYINRLFVNGTQITSFGGGTAGGTKLSISGSTLSLLNSSNTVLSSVTLPTSSGGGGGTSSNLNYLNVTLNNGYVEIDNSAGNYPWVKVSTNISSGTSAIALHVGASGAQGLWSITHNGWLISTDGQITQIVIGNSFQVGNVNKSIPSTFYGGYSSGSDIRLKNVEEYLSIPIESVANAPFFRFSWKSDGRVDVGTSAQYWQSVAPFVVYHPDEYLTMSYDKAALISVISVAKETINLKERVKQLEEEVKNLKEQQSCETTED